FYDAGLTLSAWVQKRTTKKDVAIVGTWVSKDGGGPMLWVDHVGGRYYLTLAKHQTPAVGYLDSGRTPSVGAWQHLAATYDGSVARFYVDGVEVASKPFTGNVGDSNTWRIGAYSSPVYGFFDGLIDEVRVYDRALTPEEIELDMTTRVDVPDTEPPSAPSGFATGAATRTSIQASWSPSTDNVGVAGYRLYRDGVEAGTTAGTSFTFEPLACGTSYTLAVEAFDEAGNASERTATPGSTQACDVTAPTVAVTAPADGATVAGEVAVVAEATDDDDVASVRFHLDGADLGAKDTGAPYEITWDTLSAANGEHVLTAVARDVAGNAASSEPVTVTVDNGSGPLHGLVAAYGFDQGSGTTLVDSSGNAHNGVVVGATWSGAGRFGSALSFDGVNDRVDLAGLGTFYDDGLTYEAWVKKGTTKRDVAVLGTWVAKEDGGPMIWVDHLGGRYYLTLNKSSSPAAGYLGSGRSPAVDEWQHLAATYDGAVARFYVDGVEVATKAFTGNVGDSETWRIGAYSSTPTGFFDGLVDEVRIYDRALSAGEIQSDMGKAVGPDVTRPEVAWTQPEDEGGAVPVGSTVEVTFSEVVAAASVSTDTFELRDESGSPIAATVSYDEATRTAVLTPAAELAYASAYTGIVRGGAAGVKDRAGNALEADHTWSFMTEPLPPPILVVTSNANPFSAYVPEILRAEGLNAFDVEDVASLTASYLDLFDVVLLGELPLSAGQAAMLSDWVAAGGNLVAMRPDEKLAGLLGIEPSGGALADGYLRVDTTSEPGAGIVAEAIQFHGAADRYALAGARAVATLYEDADTATAHPAVTVRDVGSSGGQAAAFTYDLARSVVYTRQGNPSWAGTDRDGIAPARTNDLFFGGDGTDWVDQTKIAIPQADEQQRLLANLVVAASRDRMPIPRFWYFPRGERAAIVMTGDDHANGGTAGRFEQYVAASPAGCSVADWECVRSTSNVYPGSPLTDAQAAGYAAAGFEIALHLNTNCQNRTAGELDGDFKRQLGEWHASYPSLASPVSGRTHCVAWGGWSSHAEVERAHGIRLDTNYYHYPASWGARVGFMTGSGLPMRFAKLDGTTIDIYQAATQMTDESGQAYPSTVDALLDRALRPEGYYGFFVANMHTDQQASVGSDAVVAAAQARGVPVISARQLLQWLDGRDGSSFLDFSWDGTRLGFTVRKADGARGLEGMLPLRSATGTLVSLTREGAPVAFRTETVKGIEYAVFPVEKGPHTATYSSS
ncbi:MAG: LamG-like jellyroll fold domain-containing protein, partial [Thermoleophilaceae bacterium]